MGANHADGFAALHEQGFVVFQAFERGDDGVETLAVAGRLAGAAVDDEFFGPLGHLRIEVVAEHAQSGFLMPALAFHDSRSAPKTSRRG